MTRFSLPTCSLRTLRRALLVPAVAVMVAGCSGTRGEHPARSGASAQDGPAGRTWVSGSGGAYAGAMNVDPGEVLLENLPWSPDVKKIDLARATGRAGFALAQVYAMADDILAVDTQGTIYCLSRRDLSSRWVSSLRAPLAAPIAEGPTYYVCLERDASGAAWVEWFSKRSGAPGNASPSRLPFAPSSGISANAGWAFVGSLGSPIDNKTIEAINLADGKVGWGYRTMSRVTATPTVDPSGEILLVVAEDRTITSLPTNQSGVPVRVNWAVDTLGVNTAAPAVAREWAYIGSEDNLLRCIDIGSGETRWMKGLDAPSRKTPWVVGRTVTKNVATGGEGSPTARVESFEGYVFAKNAIGLHAFDADTGAEVFKDANGLRPLVMERDWVVTLTENKQAQLRKGKGLPVVGTADFSRFDFLPTNGRDGEVIAAYANGVVLLATPK